MQKTVKIISEDTFNYKSLLIVPGKEFVIDEVDFATLKKSFKISLAQDTKKKVDAK